MIKVGKVYKDGKVEDQQVDEEEFPLYSEVMAILERMEQNKCHTMGLTLSEGYTLLFMVSDKK